MQTARGSIANDGCSKGAAGDFVPVVNDGRRVYATASWVQGTRQFSLVGLQGLVRFFEATGPDGQAVQGFVVHEGGVAGAGPHAGWVGQPIALEVGGGRAGVVTGRVVAFYYDSARDFAPTVLMDAKAPAGLEQAECRIACPCFSAADVGKKIWIGEGAHPHGGHGNPIAVTPLRTRIERFFTPFLVELADPLSAASRQMEPGVLVVWGTDNSAAVRLAGAQALARGQSSLVLKGRAGASPVACLFDWVPNHGPATGEEIAGSAAMAAMRWISVDCEVLVLSACGARGNEYNGAFQDIAFRLDAAPWDAPGPPQPAKGVVARQHFPRCAGLDEIVVVITGDSWAVGNAGGHAGNDHAQPIVEELIRQNPGKRIRVVNRALGGASWAWLNRRRQPSGPLPDWYIDPQAPWLDYIAQVALPDGSVIQPDLVMILMTGNNDSAPGGAIHRNDVASVIEKIRGWPVRNGLPPDIAMMCGGTKDVELFTPGGGIEGYYLAAEYVTGFLRSFARANRIALLDVGTSMSLATDGWATEHLALRQVPPLKPGRATPMRPYLARYMCRDFYMAVQLGAAGQSGAEFWQDTRNISISLSQKGDNRLWIGPDGAGHLRVCAVAWGLPVETTYGLAGGILTTCNHEQLSLPGREIRTAGPGFGLWSDKQFRDTMVGQCVLLPGVGFQGSDYRSYVAAITNSENVFACDGNAGLAPGAVCHVGGQMFVEGDALARADCVVAGAGAQWHLLTGSASLVGRCAAGGFADFHTMRLQGGGQAEFAGTGSVFLGAISVPPDYHTAVQAGDDSGGGAILTVRVQGSWARVGYVLGGQKEKDVRTRVRNNEVIVWQGDVERMGGPFVPRLWAAADVALQVVDMWVGERSRYMPQLTHRDVWGTGDPDCTSPHGGDTSHMSLLGIRQIIGSVARAQDFSLGG